MKTKKVYLFDEHEEMRKRICDMLQACSGIQVCGCASTIQEALEQIGDLCPDVILFEIKMRNRRGMEFLQKIKSMYHETKLIVATSYADGTERKQALDLGADGYWDHQQHIGTLCELILG